jgi:hypothetical protein
MRFKEYLEEEMSETKRQSIIHFQDIKPLEFLEIAEKIIQNDNKINDIHSSLKIDGASFRFGKDKSGKFFCETGRSGIIQQRNAFSEYNIQKGSSDEVLQRSKHYDDIYDLLEQSDLWKDLPDNCKIVCEILYNPMATVDKDKLKFVSVKYDKSLLGKVATLIPLEVIGDYSIEELLKKSNDKIKIISPKLKNINVNLKIDLSKISQIDKDILTSRKHKDRELKSEYLEILQDMKETIAKEILKYPKDITKLGDEYEGIVIELFGKKYKITTPEFKSQKREERLSILQK